MATPVKQYDSVDAFLGDGYSEDDLLKAANEWVKAKARRGTYADKRKEKTQGLQEMIEAARKDPNGTEAAALRQFNIPF